MSVRLCVCLCEFKRLMKAQMPLTATHTSALNAASTPRHSVYTCHMKITSFVCRMSFSTLKRHLAEQLICQFNRSDRHTQKTIFFKYTHLQYTKFTYLQNIIFCVCVYEFWISTWHVRCVTLTFRHLNAWNHICAQFSCQLHFNFIILLCTQRQAAYK